MLLPAWPAGRSGTLAVVEAAVAVLLAVPPVAAQDGNVPDTSFRVGDVRFDVHFRTQLDWRDFPDDSDDSRDVFSLHRLRAAVEVRLLPQLELEVERELRDTPEPWKDVFLNLDLDRSFQVKGGRFKIPFSLDRLTGGTRLDFVYRSLAAIYLAPARDLGLMIHGDILDRRAQYEAGVFRGSGENLRISDTNGSRGGPTVAGRMIIHPWRGAGGRSRRGALDLGAAFTSGHVPDGSSNLAGYTIAGHPLSAPSYVQGQRHRIGGEADWRTGPFSLKTEYIRALDERRGQGTDDDTLGDLITSGWYVSGTWLVTGERKDNSIQPRKPFLQGGPGAIELGARVEDLRFRSSRAGSEPPSLSPRARTVQQSDRVWTLGVSWFVNRFVRLQVNVIRELHEPGTDDMSGGGLAWSRVLRLQFEL